MKTRRGGTQATVTTKINCGSQDNSIKSGSTAPALKKSVIHHIKVSKTPKMQLTVNRRVRSVRINNNENRSSMQGIKSAVCSKKYISNEKNFSFSEDLIHSHSSVIDASANSVTRLEKEKKTCLTAIGTSKDNKPFTVLSKSMSVTNKRCSGSASSISCSTPLTSASNSASISGFSDISDTASPIIRTRKPNLKYANCVIPDNYTFLKKLLVTNATNHLLSPQILTKSSNRKKRITPKMAALKEINNSKYSSGLKQKTLKKHILKSSTISSNSSNSDQDAKEFIKKTQKYKIMLKDCAVSTTTKKSPLNKGNTSINKRSQPSETTAGQESLINLDKSYASVKVSHPIRKQKSPQKLSNTLLLQTGSSTVTTSVAVNKSVTFPTQSAPEVIFKRAMSLRRKKEASLVPQVQEGEKFTKPAVQKLLQKNILGKTVLKKGQALRTTVTLNDQSMNDQRKRKKPRRSQEGSKIPLKRVAKGVSCQEVGDDLANNSKTAPLSPLVRLSECPIKLAVFKSPMLNTSNLAAKADYSILSEHTLTTRASGSVIDVTNVSDLTSLDFRAAQPRLPKKQQLLNALREGKLNNTIDISKLKESDSKFVTPALAICKKVNRKHVKKISKTINKEKACNFVSSSSKTKDSNASLNKSDLKESHLIKKVPVWANAFSKNHKSINKPLSVSKKRLSKHLETAFDISFTSDDENTHAVKAMPKKKPVPRKMVAQKKAKLAVTRSKLLTTDPDFHTKFPTMFGVCSFYGKSGTNTSLAMSRSKAQDNTASNTLSFSPAVDYSEDFEDDDGHDAYDNPVNEESHESSGGNRIPVELEAASSFVANLVASNIPDVVIGAVAEVESGHSESACVSSEMLNNNNINTNYSKNTSNHSQSINSNKNKSLPTPDATRILSKLVGGTSTPFNVQTRGPVFQNDVAQINACEPVAEQNTTPLPAPATVDEQIKICFGFDESEEEEENEHEDGNTLNLSPVRHSTTAGNISHQVSSVSIMSEAGNGLFAVNTDVAPTRYVPVGTCGYGRGVSYGVTQHSNSAFGLSKLTMAVANSITFRTNKTGTRTKTSVPSDIQPVASAANANESALLIASHKNVAEQRPTAKTLKQFTQTRLDHTMISQASSTVPIANVQPASTINDVDCQLFDAVHVDSPVKDTLSLQGEQREEPPQHITALLTPEKSFHKPPRKSYDRHSLEVSRRFMLEAIAGDAPDVDDDNLADQEDTSQSSTAPRRKKRTPKLAKSVGTSQGSVTASKREPNKRRAQESSKAGNADIAQGDEHSSPVHVKSPKLHVRRKKRVNNVTASNKTKRTKLKLMSKAQGSSEDSTASTSGIFSLSRGTNIKSTKAAAFEKSYNDWASDLNSHFSEIEDCELAVA